MVCNNMPATVAQEDIKKSQTSIHLQFSPYYEAQNLGAPLTLGEQHKKTQSLSYRSESICYKCFCFFFLFF